MRKALGPMSHMLFMKGEVRKDVCDQLPPPRRSGVLSALFCLFACPSAGLRKRSPVVEVEGPLEGVRGGGGETDNILLLLSFLVFCHQH